MCVWGGAGGAILCAGMRIHNVKYRNENPECMTVTWNQDCMSLGKHLISGLELGGSVIFIFNVLTQSVSLLKLSISSQKSWKNVIDLLFLTETNLKKEKNSFYNLI